MSKQQKNERPSLEAAPKKPYLKPSYEREKIFETQALNCGKMQGNEGSCRSNRKNS